jgi:glycosyltransferase involved in cell wall biosynthesis
MTPVPEVSIVIPVYNSGAFLVDSIDSIDANRYCPAVEIVVVDDGSTDLDTIHLLGSLAVRGVKVFRQENKGPGAARNLGVLKSSGRNIVFLDSDNRIRPEMIETGSALLRTNAAIGGVYGAPIFFGDTDVPRFCAGQTDRFEILVKNSVDVCAMIRREVWDSVDGFDEDPRLIGFEDWDFWIRVLGNGWRLEYVSETWYEYRIRADSLVQSALSAERYKDMIQYMHTKHEDQFTANYAELIHVRACYENDKERPLRSFSKYLYHKYLKR